MEQPIVSHTKTSPRDFFLYLFATASLYFCAVDLIALLRQYVNYFFPDPFSYSSFGISLSSGMRLSMAFLIVLFPAYVISMWILGREIDRDPSKQNIWVRRWSLYLTLFLSGATMLGDLVYLVYSFLGGDFTARFILQALAILVVAAAVFGYYLFVLRRAPGSKKELRKGIAIGSLVIVAALVIGAFFIVGSPVTNRIRTWDAQRVSNLQDVQYRVINYWQQKEKLPASIDELNDPLSGYTLPSDPETQASYEYRATGDRTFELCAVFGAAYDPANDPGGSEMRYYPYSGLGDENWKHDEGRSCFTRTIDPDQYPPFDTSPASPPAYVPPPTVIQ